MSDIEKRNDLNKRMKDYEEVSKTRLIKRMPVIIRIDGRAFHTFTENFVRPFDEVLIKTMQETTKYLCENIMGCVLGYTQSDEISLVLVDYKNLDSSAWFDNEVQKICSISASMATIAFNKFFKKNVEAFKYDDGETEDGLEKYNLLQTYLKALDKGAMFDARCFNLSKEEVTNYFYSRQLDASRNSIQMVGQAYFAHKELNCKTCNDIMNMLVLQKNINWNNFPIYQKRGSCVIKSDKEITTANNIGTDGNVIGTKTTVRSKWIIDIKIPIFKGEGRDYIEQLINF